MEWITTQSYVEVDRKIEDGEQKSFEIEQSLFLSTEKIVSSGHQFTIEEVYDISFRKLSQTYGWLYLHTNQGVFPFRTKSNPEFFISEFKKLK